MTAELVDALVTKKLISAKQFEKFQTERETKLNNFSNAGDAIAGGKSIQNYRHASVRSRKLLLLLALFGSSVFYSLITSSLLL